MPLIFILHSLSVLDRSNLGNARIAGLAKDLDLTGRRYDWLATAFYISYILSQWTTIGWKAFKANKRIAFAVFGWGLVSTLQSLCSTWAGLMPSVSGNIRSHVRARNASVFELIPSQRKSRLSNRYLSEWLGAGQRIRWCFGNGIAQEKSSVHPWKVLFFVEVRSPSRTRWDHDLLC
jgi:hypothetical protein